MNYRDLIRRLVDLLFEPDAILPDPNQRNRARLLALLSLAFLVIAALVAFVQGLFVTDFSFGLADVAVRIAGHFIVVAVYGLSRTRYHIWGARIFAPTVSLALLSMAYLNPTSTLNDLSLDILVIAVALSGLLLSLSATAIIAVLNSIALALLPIFGDRFSFDVIIEPLTFNIFLSVLVWGAFAIHERDVARIEQQQQELSASEDRYRRLLEHSPSAIFVHISDTIVYANPALAILLGAGNSQELVGKQNLDFVHPDYHNQIRVRRQHVRVTGQAAAPTEQKMIRLDGQIIDVEATAVGISYQDERAILVALRDVTEQKRAEIETLRHTQELMESEERYRRLIETAPLAIFVTIGNEIVFANTTMARLVGARSAEQLVGEYDLKIFQPETHDLIEQRKRFIRETGGPTEPSERKLLRLDGSLVDILITGVKITYQGYHDAIQVVFSDITEHKQAEAEIMQRNQELLALHTASATIAFSLDLQKVLDTVAEEMAKLMDVEGCTIMELDVRQAALVTRAEYGPPNWFQEDDPLVYPLAENPTAKLVLESKHPMQYTVSSPVITETQRAYLREHELKTVLILPMLYQDTVIGTADLEDSRVVRTFTDREIATAQVLLNYAASAFQNARLYQTAQDESQKHRQAEVELSQRNHELLVLQMAASAVSSSLDLQDVIDTVTREAANLIGVAGCVISEWDEAAESVIGLGEYGPLGPEGSEIGKVYHLAEYPCTRHVLVERQPVQYTISQPEIDPAEAAFMQNGNIKSLLMIPVVFQDKCIGLAEFKDFQTERTFTLQEIAIVQLLLNQTASAIQNARLYQMAQEESIKHKEAIDALLESETRFRTVVESLGEGIALISLEDQFLYVNKRLAEIFGFTVEEMVGEYVHDLLFPLDVPKEVMSDRISQRLQGISERYEIQLRRKAGSLLSVEISASPYRDATGEIVGVLAVITDLTRRKQAQAQQLELDLEKEKVRVLEQFIGDTSHDLKTPLAVIKTRLYLIEKKAANTNDHQRHLDVLKSQTEHLEQMLEDLLNMTRLDQAAADFNFVYLELNALLQPIAEAHESLALDKGHTLQCSWFNDSINVLADRQHLRRAVTNILVNALNYTPAGGLIKLETDVVDRQAIIRVRDTGVGIATEDLPHIFSRFYRADKARGSSSGGTGLGLSISQKIIHSHGGEVTVTSVPGEGTVFCIYLPIPDSR